MKTCEYYECAFKSEYVCNKTHASINFLTDQNTSEINPYIESVLINEDNKEIVSLKQMIEQLYKDQINQIIKKREEEIARIQTETQGQIINIRRKLWNILKKACKMISIDQDLCSRISEIISCHISLQEIKSSLANLNQRSTSTYKTLESEFSYFLAYPKMLVEVQNSNLATRQINLDTFPTIIADFPSATLLRDGNLIQCGGYKFGRYLNTCYMINPRTLEWQRLPDLPIGVIAHTIFQKNEHLYIFGGSNDRPVASSLKYSLRKQTWKQIEDMPFTSYSVCCVSAHNCILIAGIYSRGVYSYRNKKYKKIFNCEEGYCVLLKNKIGELFLLTENKIFKSHYSKYKDWTHVGVFSVNFKLILTYPVLYKNTFHFRINPSNHITFNYETLKVESKIIN